MSNTQEQEIPKYGMDFNGTEYFIYERPSMRVIYSSSTHGEAARRRTVSRLKEIVKEDADPETCVATIKLSVEKVVVTRRAQEAADLKQADCAIFQQRGFTVTGLSFLYEGDGKTRRRRGC